MWRSTAKRILFGLVVAALVLASAEGMARIYRAFASNPIRYGYPDELTVAHPVRGFALRPDFRGNFTGERFAHIPIEINRDGYRDGPPPDADSHNPRIAVLGDSVTFGSGVEAAQRFSDQLERHLDDVRVLNLGVHSYTLGHYLDQVRHDVPHYRPEVVLVAFTVNDIASMDDSVPARGPGQAAADSGWSQRSALVWWAVRLRRSGALALTRDPMERLETAWTRWERRVARQWQRPEALARLRRELSRLAAEVHGQGRRLLVAAMPDRFALRDPVAFGLPRRTLLAELQDQGIDAVDLVRVFADHPDPDSLFLLADPIHLSPQGHALVARTLAPYLEARLPAPGPTL